MTSSAPISSSRPVDPGQTARLSAHGSSINVIAFSDCFTGKLTPKLQHVDQKHAEEKQQGDGAKQ